MVISRLLVVKFEGNQKSYMGASLVVVKNLPAKAGDRGSIPDPTGHGAAKPTRHNYSARALEPWNSSCWAHKLHLLKPEKARAHALPQEKPPRWEARAVHLERSSCPRQLERKPARQQRPSTAKNKQFFFKLYMDFLLCESLAPLILTLFEGQIYIYFLITYIYTWVMYCVHYKLHTKKLYFLFFFHIYF